jgi:hypothetical protein
MAITEIAYCTREQVQRALNLADLPRLNGRVDAAIMSGARQVHGLLHRKFYPTTTTYAFDQPEAGTLWLDQYELAAAPTQIISGTQAMTVGTDVFLRPLDGPPYMWIEANYGGRVFWQSVSTPQAAISITGDFGYPVTVNPVTMLGLTAGAGVSTLILNDSSQVGVGSLLLIDAERMIVSDKTVSVTGATLTADLTNSKASVSIPVSSGALIFPGEMILIDSERMFVEYVAGNTLTVDRAVNGSTLAVHSNGATIYAGRTATVLRARLGTTAASHSSGATVNLLSAPSLISELNLAYAINNNEAALAAYSRASSPDTTSLYRDRGRGLTELAADVVAVYGRQMRTRAVGT